MYSYFPLYMCIIMDFSYQDAKISTSRNCLIDQKSHAAAAGM